MFSSRARQLILNQHLVIIKSQQRNQAGKSEENVLIRIFIRSFQTAPEAEAKSREEF
jgi:hypothetical protein